MRCSPNIFSFVLCLFAVSCIAQCSPDDEQTAKISRPLGEKFRKDICGQGIKPGGQADLDFVNKQILPKYLSKAWLTKDPPKGWEKERDKIVARCHKNTYNYCNEVEMNIVRECVKTMTGSLMFEDVATVTYCPILDAKIENFETSGDKEQVLAFFTAYCETKGIVC